MYSSSTLSYINERRSPIFTSSYLHAACGNPWFFHVVSCYTYIVMSIILLKFPQAVSIIHGNANSFLDFPMWYCLFMLISIICLISSRSISYLYTVILIVLLDFLMWYLLLMIISLILLNLFLQNLLFILISIILLDFLMWYPLIIFQLKACFQCLWSSQLSSTKTLFFISDLMKWYHTYVCFVLAQ